jgi:hypothetical protein
MADTEIKIEVAPSGKQWQVTLVNGDARFVDVFNLRSAKARATFCGTAVSKFPGILRKSFETELDKLAASLPSDNDKTTTQAEGEELPASMVLRPELFLTPEVCGIAIPRTSLMAGEPVARWALHLQWRDGKREIKTLEHSLEVGDKRIFFNPIPDKPSTGANPGWDIAGRKQWANGGMVNPLEVFAALCEAITFYIDLPYPESTTAVIALWVMLTYLYPAWDAVPYFYTGGPKGSGKTRLFEVLARLVFRAFCSSNISAPCLFRTLHNNGGTLVLDEAERLKESTPDALEIRSILLAGYKRGGKASRLEASGDTFKMVEFQVFGPKAIGCIAGLPGPLMDRCISIIMFRAPAGSEKPKRRIDETPERWQALRNGLHAIALQYGSHIAAVAAHSEVCPSEISGRNYELWQPLMALASWIESHGGQGLLSVIQDHAARSIAEQTDDGVGEVEEIVLKALTMLVQSGSRPTAKDVLAQARECACSVWFANNEKPWLKNLRNRQNGPSKGSKPLRRGHWTADRHTYLWQRAPCTPMYPRCERQ